MADGELGAVFKGLAKGRGWLDFTWPELARTVDRFSAAPHRGAIHLQARNGRLDQTALARQCPTPRRTIEVADALGVAAPGLPN